LVEEPNTSAPPAAAKEAFAAGKTVRQVAREKRVLSDDVLDKALDPRQMMKPLAE
jgi:aspartate ammonia-lyase